MIDVIAERDIFQSRLLAFLFSNSTEHELALKGGMALHALYGSQRYTKDIDLDHNPSRSLSSLQTMIRKSLKDAVAGYLSDAQISEPKQTDTVARWKIAGTLKNGQRLNMTIEVSRREFDASALVSVRHLAPANVRAPIAMIDGYSMQKLAENKFWCVVDEVRVAPRDIYDLHVIASQGVAPRKGFLREHNNLGSLLERMWAKIESYTWEAFESEVLPFLPAPERSRFDRDAFEAMVITVGETLHEWIRSEEECKLNLRPPHP